jgi:phosphatidylglycerophosphate synthase
MPSEKSLPGSDADFEYRRAALKSDNRHTPKFLQLNKYLNRPLASLIVRAVFRTWVTPNHLTVLSFLIGLAGAFCFFQGRTRWVIAGGILIEISSIVDCADGMLARARGRMSEFGAYLDRVFDRVNEFFLITGYSYGFYRLTGRHDILVLGLVTCGLYFLQTTFHYLLKEYFRDPAHGETAEIRAWLMFLPGVFAVANRMDWGVYVLFAASLSILTFQIARFFRSRPIKNP